MKVPITRLAAIALCMGGVLAAQAASARQVPATAGHPVGYSNWFKSGSDAWTQSFGSVAYAGNPADVWDFRSWEIDLPVDNAGNHSVTVQTGSMISGQVGSYISCISYGTSPDGLSVWAGSTAYQNFSDSPLTSSNAYVPSYGAYYVNCSIPAAKWLGGASYNP